MIQEFVRFKSTDNIEMCGVLYKPKNGSDKTIIHIHGLCGNFYENRFVSYLANLYTNKGYNFLTFNNRGCGYFFDLLKEDGEIEFIDGGGTYEKFEECLFDIEGVINYCKNNGINKIILQGHSYGCNKAVYYYNKKKDPIISRLILLAPCDIVGEIEVFMGEKYKGCVEHAKKLMNENRDKELIDSPLFPMTFSAKTFTEDWIPDSKADIFRYRIDNYISEELLKTGIPVLIEIGSIDTSALIVEKEKVDKFFKENFKNNSYRLNYIENASHIYLNKEELLVKDIEGWI